MTRDFFVELINSPGLLGLAVIIYATGFIVTFKLGFKILGLNIPFKHYYPAVSIMLLYSFFAKWIIGGKIYGLVTAVLICVFLTVIGRVKILVAAWTSAIITLISAIGEMLIFLPVAAINKTIGELFLKTLQGNLIVSLLEIVFPLITLTIIPKLKFSLIPPLVRNKNINIFGIIAYGAVYYLVFNSTMQLYYILKSSEGNVPQAFISQLAALFIAIAGYYKYISDIKILHKRELAQLQEKIEQLQRESSTLRELNLRIENNSLDTPAAIAALQSIIRNQMLLSTTQLKELALLNAEVENKKRNLKRIK